MRQRSVHWYEGMFLRPQHFQVSDRYWEDTVAKAIQWRCGYSYGIRYLRIQRESLGASFFQLNGGSLVLRDGTLIELDGMDLRLDLKAAFAKTSEAIVCIAVPKMSLGRPNTTEEDTVEHRFRVHTVPFPDENSGSSEVELNVRQLTSRLMLSSDNIDGFETIPIARIKRAGSSEATPELDENYFPPMLACDAWEHLHLGVIRAIYDLIGQKMEVLAQRVEQRRLTLSSPEPGDLDDLWMLSQLNQSRAVLHGLTFATGVHPFTAYIELCRTYGQLSVFGSSRQLDPDLPAYDHDDLATVFRWLQRRIGELIGTTKALEYEQRFFEGVERGMQVSLDPKWMHQTWKWYVGVHAENAPEDICRELLRPGVLDWKMGSAKEVELLFKHRMPDVKADEELRAVPRSLPSQRGWIYFEVRREGPAWKDVLATQSLAMRFNTGVIANLDRLRGQRKLEVIYRERRAILEFALFAVPGATP